MAGDFYPKLCSSGTGWPRHLPSWLIPRRSVWCCRITLGSPNGASFPVAPAGAQAAAAQAARIVSAGRIAIDVLATTGTRRARKGRERETSHKCFR
jgi:hypothetical protein